MLGLKSHMNFYLCHGSVDMRKGIVSLSELVRRTMNASPENGDVFIFLGKDRRNLKILRHGKNWIVSVFSFRCSTPILIVMRLVGISSLSCSKALSVKNFSYSSTGL